MTPEERDRIVSDYVERFKARLERVAHHLRAKNPGHTLTTHDLVQEGLVRHFATDARQFNDDQHFLSAMAQAMHQALVDYERKRRATKRNEGRRPISLSALENSQLEPVADPALDEAITSLDIEEQLTALRDQRHRDMIYQHLYLEVSAAELASRFDTTVSEVRRVLAGFKVIIRRSIAHES